MRISRQRRYRSCSMTTGATEQGGSVSIPDAPRSANPENQSPRDASGKDESPLPLDHAVQEAVNRALRGNPAVLRQVLADNVSWRGPMGNFDSVTDVEGELRSVGQLLTEPRMTVIRSKGEQLEWIASGTWPLPWLPRFIVRGKSDFKIGSNGKVIEITDSWDGNLVTLAIQHLFPRFWDIWHQLVSPPPEKQPYRVTRRGKDYELREYTPRLAVQPSLIDRSNSRELRMALILPNFCHTGELRTSGRSPDEYYVTSPVEVSIQPIIETGVYKNGTWFNGTVRQASTSQRANRIAWSIPVPTAFGLNAEALPYPSTDPDENKGERASIVREDFRTIAVTSFNGLPQDVEAAEVRSTLLSTLAADGVRVKKGEDGRFINGMLLYNTKACFSRKGHMAMSLMEYRPKWIGIGNEIYVEISETRNEPGDATQETTETD